MKKLLSIVCVILIIFSIAVFSVNSESSYNLTLFGNCKELFTYNGKSSAYVFGYNSDTLYSAKVLPTVSDIRYTSVEGRIRSVCHNDKFAYALYEDKYKNRNYYVLQMNMTDGNCKYYYLGNYPAIKTTSFAVSDNEIFLIHTDNYYSYIVSMDFNGEELNKYQFDGVVSEVFVNNSKIYAHLYNGEIYCIGNGKYQYVAGIDSGVSLCNAGVGWIYTDNKTLVSLENNTQQKVYTAELNCIVNNYSVIYVKNNKTISSEDKYYNMSDNIIALLSSGNNIAALSDDYSCKVISKSELKSAAKSSAGNFTDTNRTNIGSSYYLSDDIIYGVESGTTVSQFKNSFSSAVKVYDSDGNEVTADKMKTGYSTIISNNLYYVAVKGDITGEGNLKSNDVSALMSVLADKTQLSGVFYVSADFNYDGKVNNQDLVLLAQESKQ